MDYATSITRTTEAQREPALPESVSAVAATGLPGGCAEEALITDARASLTPAQMVERKLVSLLKSNPLPVSHLMTGTRNIRRR